MEILYVNDQLLPTDETDTEQIIQTIAALCDCGVSITLCLPAQIGGNIVSLPELEAYYQVQIAGTLKQTRIRGAHLRVIAKLFYPFKLCLAVRNRKSQIVYTRNLPTVVIFLLFSKLSVVYETYRPWQQQLRILKPLLAWMARHPRLLGVITHSEYTRQVFLQNGYVKDKVRAILNGYDPQRMLPEYSKVEARKKLGIDMGHPVAVYTGHISISKGCGILLQMAEQLPNVLFVLVGSTGKGEVEQRAKQMENVHIINWLPFAETVPYLTMADVLIIPPTSIPLAVGRTVLPIKTFLYMAAGRTILAPRSPDTEELLRHGENSFLVEADNIEQAVKALRQLADNTELAGKLAATAKEEVSAYSYKTRGEKVVLFLRERLDRGKL